MRIREIAFGVLLSMVLVTGVNRAGFDTCWLKINSEPSKLEIVPTFQVSSLEELGTLLFRNESKLSPSVHLDNRI